MDQNHSNTGTGFRSPLCPKRALLNMVRLSPASPTDHLFSYQISSSRTVITQYSFVQFLRSKLQKCGYEYKYFSGHSLRRGGVPLGHSLQGSVLK